MTYMPNIAHDSALLRFTACMKHHKVVTGISWMSENSWEFSGEIMVDLVQIPACS